MTLVEIKMPDSTEGTENAIGRWLKNAGQEVKENEPLIEINTDKVTLEIAAPASGVLLETIKVANDKVEPGDVLGKIQVGASLSTATLAQQDSGSCGRQTAVESAPTSAGASERLSPLVKKLLQENGLTASQITGTGAGGRITAEDIQAFIAKGSSSAAPTAAASGLPSHMLKHSPMRKSIANHMVESMLKTAPHVTAIFEADMTAVIKHRAANKEAFAAKGVNLTFTAYFVQAIVAALKAVPEVNSRFHSDALEVFDTFNIGIATALEKVGLVVPVLRGAEKLDLFATADALGKLVEKARANKLEKSELEGGTFTITNHGVSGSLIATPIINQPQSAILGLGKLEKRVRVVEKKGKDEFEARSMLYVTLTIDHRALDGFQANSFLSAFVSALETV